MKTTTVLVTFSAASVEKIESIQRKLRKQGKPYNKGVAANFIVESAKVNIS